MDLLFAGLAFGVWQGLRRRVDHVKTNGAFLGRSSRAYLDTLEFFLDILLPVHEAFDHRQVKGRQELLDREHPLRDLVIAHVQFLFHLHLDESVVNSGLP